MKNKKAQGLIEYGIIIAMVAVIAVVVYSKMFSSKNITKLKNMSSITIKK